MIGQTVSEYRVVGKLGAGGMGDVWLAHDAKLERDVALKMLPQELAGSAEALQRFRHEALALAALNHPNIATIYGLAETPDGSIVLVLERVVGVTLAERIHNGLLPRNQSLNICVQIALALEAAHERGIVHRDLKPGNVMIGDRGQVKVLDFGLAQRSGQTRLGGGGRTPTAESDAPTIDTSASTPDVSGTPSYMSPEQALGNPQDCRTDIFAFGCVLYECLSGRRAFSADDDPIHVMRLVLTHDPDMTALAPETSERLRQLLSRCLEKDPAKRLSEIRSARHELEEELGIRQASVIREGGSPATPTNLPSEATSFIGREAILAGCSHALAETRMLTLVGMGGSGKTRLALRLARMSTTSFTDGVWFVDVAPLTEADRLVHSVAAALGISDEAGLTPLESVTTALSSRRALIFIDNAETQASACADMSSHLLRSCPSLKILVTSREPIGIDGETTFTVPALELPAEARPSTADAMKSDAVRLFVERARNVSPVFELTDSNCETVTEICRRLDGIPLALELAAARVRVLNVEQIREKLSDRFRLLTRSGASASRQQTVLAVIQWSWDHLLEPEQSLMRKLAIFPGGWTLERATAICSEKSDEFEILDLLTRLAERSLLVVHRDPKANPRYRFLESVWRFALDRFEDDPQRDAVRERYVAEYVKFAREAGKTLQGAGAAQASLEIALEEENIHAALALCARINDGVSRALWIASSIHRFWGLHGRIALGRSVLEDVLARDSARTATEERASALLRVGGYQLTMGDFEKARISLEESLEIDRALGKVGGAQVSGLGVVAMYQGRYEDALALTEQGSEIYRKAGNRRGFAMGLHNIATIEYVLKRPGFGTVHFEKALQIFQEQGDSITESLCLSGLATARLHCGNPSEARELLLKSLAIVENTRAVREGVYVLESVAELLVASSRFQKATRLLGGAAAIRNASKLVRIPSEQAEYQSLLDAIVAALGQETATQHFAEGQQMEFEALMIETRAELISL